MKTKEQLTQAVADAKASVAAAEKELDAFDSLAENNVFATLEEAEGVLDELLYSRAFQDCEGAHNCGQDKYTQEFMVDGVKYRATETFEYNRHDKMYYYIEEHQFKYEKIV